MTITPLRGRTPARVRNRRRHAAASVEPRHALTPLPDVPGSRRAPGRPAYLNAALVRCALYLGPISVAVAAAGPLARVAWPVPLVTLLLGWTAAQALTSTGATVARRAGIAPATRLVGAGFAAVAGLWCALVWIAPDRLIGPERGLALVIGLGGLATMATVTAAVVARSEKAIILWSLPCWLLAAATPAGLVGNAEPVQTLLPAAIVAATVRSFRSMVVPGVRSRVPRLTAAERGLGGAYLVIGASQAICVGVLWQAGPSGSTAPFWLPLLLAVPILEALIGWHNAAPRRRRVAATTLLVLLPPLAAGVALAVAAHTLPAAVSAPAGGRAGLLGLAGGMLLGGVFAITFLLARTRTVLAAALAAASPVALALLHLLSSPAAGPLPSAVGVLAATHLAGLLAVALTVADPRRTS